MKTLRVAGGYSGKIGTYGIHEVSNGNFEGWKIQICWESSLLPKMAILQNGGVLLAPFVKRLAG